VCKVSIKHFTRSAAMAASFAALFSIGTSAHANPILTFGQTGNGDTITAIANSTNSTTIVADKVAVDITELYGSSSTPIEAIFNMALDSTGSASLIGSILFQEFGGTFSIMSGATTYLAGTVSNLLIGTNGSPDAALIGGPTNVSFTSDVMDVASMSNYGMTLALADITPNLAMCGSTICGFTASVSGDFSATVPATPEASTWAMMILGVLGMGFLAYRKRKALPSLAPQPTLSFA
jgi:hypothetical protein